MPEEPHHYDFTPVHPDERSIFDRHGDKRPSRGGGDPITAMLGAKLWIPLFLFTLWILYPISGCVAFATLWVLSTLLGFLLPSWIALLLAALPALVVLWLMCRWDCAMGQNRIYWTVRHIFRLCAIMGFLLYAVTSDRHPNPTFGQVVHNVISTPEILTVSLILLGVLHWILASREGMIKTFWRGGLELIRLRPQLDESTEIIMPRRHVETYAEVKERLLKQNRR